MSNGAFWAMICTRHVSEAKKNLELEQMKTKIAFHNPMAIATSTENNNPLPNV
jgi:hypothetical protein